MPRIYTPQTFTASSSLALDAGAARHVQVLRMQPGDDLTLFNGQGGEYSAAIEQMGRSHVQVMVGVHNSVEREASRAVHLAIGMPANERMDWLIEKATELGAASIQPLMTERSVLRLSGERAEKKLQHWQAAAVAACEQCGRNRVPVIHSPVTYQKWLVAYMESAPNAINLGAIKAVLSLQSNALPAAQWANHQPSQAALLCLAGPEGGLSLAEESAAIAAGFSPITLGSRTLRSETAPLAALAVWTLN
jgi:16S rRNA (uracil1498-N3)-methyltransferase